MSEEVKISVIKFEMVNGKKTYKSFTFKLNPKEMAKFKTEATVKKKVAEYVAKSGVYKPSELQNLKYDMKEFLEEWQKMVPVVEAEELAKLDKSPNNPETRVTPHLISRLAAGEIFVFGSNAMGHHDGGAAKTALEKFGAIRGQGHGLQGMSYAIDSTSGMEAMKKDVDEFIEFAKNHPDKTFFVTLIGCGIAGLTIYLYHEKIYNEQKQKVSRFRGFSHINLFSLQYIGTLRAKRVRTMVIMITAIFLFDAYLFALLPAEAGQEMGDKVAMTTLYVAGAILLPSVVLSQWTFGIEANFFHGLMTKPVKVKQMLQNCFYYYMAVSAIALLLTLPFLFLEAGIGIQVLISGFCLAVFINLFNLPTALFSSRLEIFQTSMFSMQGANLKINLYAIAFLFPLAGVCAIYHFFGETAWFITCVALSVISIAIHKWFIAKIAAIFEKNKYKRMEKFMES